MDNLWQSLDLVKVGIPQGYTQIGPQNRPVVVIMTRDQQICHKMQADSQVIVLQRLEIEEAWSLFDENAGCHRLTNSSVEIRDYAQNIVKKCGGLPLALKMKLAVMFLQKSQFHKVLDADAEQDLFEVLYISYDKLSDQRTKECFLLFAWSNYDYIYVPNTIDIWMGHGLLDEDDDISNSYSTGHSVIGRLKRAGLLEEHPRGQSFLRMHDTIRGLALWIVKSKQGDGPNKNWLVHRGKETVKPEEWSGEVVIPNSCPCPWLSTLLITSSNIIGKFPLIGFFAAAPSLTYLDLRRTNIQELPSDVGELVNLQHLDLSETPIQSIPAKFHKLKSLRYLYLVGMRELKTILDGTISALSMLRIIDLHDTGSFPADKTLAYIKEMESLTSLQSLGFTVRDSESLQRILDPSKASLRSLCVVEVEGLQHLYFPPPSSRKMRAHQLKSLVLAVMQSLKELTIGETIVDSDWHFEILDALTLAGLEKLETIIWKGVVPCACLPRLRKLIISECHSIRAIMWIKQLPCLEELYLVDCDSMLQLMADEGGGTMSSAGDSFPCLKWLGLSHLGSLRNICDATLAFPCLQRLLVYKCPLLTELPPGLLKPELAPLIFSEQDWWEQLSWEDTSVNSTSLSFFRNLPASFNGNINELLCALAHH